MKISPHLQDSKDFILRYSIQHNLWKWDLDTKKSYINCVPGKAGRRCMHAISNPSYIRFSSIKVKTPSCLWLQTITARCAPPLLRVCNQTAAAVCMYGLDIGSAGSRPLVRRVHGQRPAGSSKPFCAVDAIVSHLVSYYKANSRWRSLCYMK